jgi:hypothetical protein
VDRYVVVGSEFDLGLTYHVTQPVVAKCRRLGRRKNVFRDECEELHDVLQRLREDLQDKLAATVFLNFMASPEWPKWQAKCIRVAPLARREVMGILSELVSLSRFKCLPVCLVCTRISIAPQLHNVVF